MRLYITPKDRCIVPTTHRLRMEPLGVLGALVFTRQVLGTLGL